MSILKEVNLNKINNKRREIYIYNRGNEIDISESALPLFLHIVPWLNDV